MPAKTQPHASTDNGTATRRKSPTWLLFAAAGIIWGASFLFIKIGVEGLNPVQVVLSRLGLGAATLVIVMLVTRTPWIRDSRIVAHAAVAGVFVAGVPLLLFAWAAQFLPSGISAIFNSTTPLLTLLFAAIVIPSERLGAWRTLGVLVGAGGILMVVGPWRYLANGEALGDLAHTGPAYLACLGATACYAISYVYLRRFVDLKAVNGLAMTTVQISTALVVVLAFSPLLGVAQPVAVTAPIVISMALLGILGTGLAYVWNNQVIAQWGPVRASMVTYITPIVGVVLGIVILGETVSWNEPVGMTMVLVGISMAQGLIASPWTTRSRG